MSPCAARKSPSSAGVSDAPARTTMHAITWSPATGSGTPYTAASAMAGWRSKARSIGAVPRFSPSTRSHWPARPANQQNPSESA